MRVPACLSVAVCAAAAAWWSRRRLRQALTNSELARVLDSAAHQHTTAHLATALDETTARLRAALVLAAATDVVNRAQSREES